MSKNQTILNYKGPIEFKTIELLLQKVKNDLEPQNIRKVLKKRVYNIMVECIENILKHKVTDASTEIHPYILLEKDKRKYLITAGNVISNEDVELLRQKLNDIINQDKEVLLKMYEDQINREEILQETGAGLGLITMALKSNSKISYSFTPVNGKLSVFELQVTVPFDH